MKSDDLDTDCAKSERNVVIVSAFGTIGCNANHSNAHAERAAHRH